MVRKLLKHEAIFYGRTMLPMLIVMLGMGIITRLVWFFEGENTTFSIVSTSALIVLIVAMIIGLVMSVIVGVKRFYTNLYTSEGYFSFTLPVTSSAHIFTKLLMAIACFIATIIAVAVSSVIAMGTEVFFEVFKAIGYLAGKYFELTGTHGIFYIIEMVLLVLVMVSTTYLLLYACITVGQLARKNRVLAAFGVYFGYYVFSQIVGTILMILISVYYEYIPIGTFVEFANNHPFAVVHWILAISIALTTLCGILYFVITNTIMKKRINLE